MPWELINRDDRFYGSNKAFVTITHTHFFFNVMFVRIAELGPDKHVTIYADPEKLKLGFEFHSDEKPNSFVLFKSRTSVACTSRGITLKYPWVKSVTKLTSNERRFSPTQEGKLWVIQLCPAFEDRKARESTDIPSGLYGIYRYLRENNEIVYIGRGEIKKRLMSPERKDWDFDIVEYSIVKDPDQQVKWEDYWITKYKEKNKGKLPFYNKISGLSSKNSPED